MQAQQSYTQAQSGAYASSSQSSLSDELLLKRYRVMGSCGVGGFGTVLACWDTRLQRRVALKRMRLAPAYPVGGGTLAATNGVPNAGAASIAGGNQAQVPATQAIAATIEEALAEARTASRLTHPGIVAVHDFAVEDGVAYLVMEYVDGLNLAELLARVEGGRLTHDEAAYLVQQLGAAVAFAHREGVLHLDIKPSNVMLTRDGHVKLCDFGMATLASAAGYADARGGTVGYMPPEQVEDGMVDERTDVFALAVVLTQALTGVSPFAAQTAEQSCALIRRGPKPRLSKLDPELGGMAEQTLLACLSADPAQRPPDANATSADLAFGLGDPDEGARSLAGLLAQIDKTADDTDPEWEGERLPLYYRYPWMYDRLMRIATGVAAAVLTSQMFPHLPLAAQVPQLVAALAVGVASMLWTPVASLVVGLGFAACLFLGQEFSGGPISITAALVLVSALGTWWAHHVHNKDASLALLAAPALGLCGASSAFAAATLSPFAAAVTTAFAWIFTSTLNASLAAEAARDFFATGLPFDLGMFHEIMTLSHLVSLGGCVLGAGLGAAVTRSGQSVARGVLGQIVCCAITIFFQLLAGRMENSSIWPAPRWETVGVAVLFAVIVSFALAIRGPRDADGEDEDLA